MPGTGHGYRMRDMAFSVSVAQVYCLSPRSGFDSRERHNQDGGHKYKDIAGTPPSDAGILKEEKCTNAKSTNQENARYADRYIRRYGRTKRHAVILNARRSSPG